MERLKQIVACLLLLVLSTSFLPTESFHHHEGEQIICKNTDTHFDEHLLACDLCDFLLKEYAVQSFTFTLIERDDLPNFVTKIFVEIDKDNYQTPLQRGPPFLG